MSPVDGFSHESIFSLVIDKDGFVWFHNGSAIYRFDAYVFEKIEMGQRDKLVSVHNLLCDDQNRLFATTDKGVWQYNRTLNCFQLKSTTEEYMEELVQYAGDDFYLIGGRQLYRFDPVSGETHPVDIHSTYPDAFLRKLHSVGQRLFISTHDGDIYEYSPARQEMHLIIRSQSDENVLSIRQRRHKLFFITRYKGLFEYDLSSGVIVHHGFADISQSRNNMGKSLYIDKLDNVWIGTQRGLYLFNPDTYQYKVFTNNPTDPFSLPNNSVDCFAEDDHGGLWIGLFSGQLAYCNISYDQPFFTIRHMNEELSNTNFVSCIEEDRNGLLYIGTEGGGINVYNRRTRTMQNFRYNPPLLKLANDNIKSLFFDKGGNLWVAMFSGGINRFAPDASGAIDFRNIWNDPVIGGDQYYIHSDGTNGVWVGGRDGVYHYNAATGQLRFESLDEIKDDGGKFTIYQQIQYQSHLWVFTSTGLYRMDLDTGEVTEIRFEKNRETDGCSFLFCGYIDQAGYIWIGTADYGLCVYDPQHNTLTKIPEIEASHVYSILDSDDRTLWMGTNNGLYSYTMTSGEARLFVAEDGLQSNLFYPNSALKLSGGELAFGGANGVTIFDPQRIVKNPFAPNVVIKNVFINNESYKGDREKEITLNYKQNVIGFEFTALNYLMSSKNKFAYMLEGKDTDWQLYTGDTRSISYSDLSPGRYVFTLKASNNDGVWNEEVSTVGFRVYPAPWFSGWAYLIYGLLLVAAAFFTRRYYKEKQRNRERMMQIEFEKEKTEQLIQMKIEFFTNISHEFKTPLTLIVTPLKKMMEDRTMITDKGFEIVYKNALKLQHLISELMEFRTIQSNKLRLKLSRKELFSFLKELLFLFEDTILAKNIEYSVDVPEKEQIVLSDFSKLEKIATNLLSNALKNTPENGIIIFQADYEPDAAQQESGMFYFTITNTTYDLNKNDLHFIFDEYFKKEDPNYDNSGIGLAYTKELIRLLGGQISARVENNEFVLSVQIPVDNRDDSISEPAGQVKYEYKYVEKNLHLFRKEQDTTARDKDYRRLPLVLLVEDHADLLHYLADMLSADYRILCARNGKEALGLVIQEKPSLIVTDVMMSELNGIELCQELKKDIQTSHIPVIMLSAVSGMSEKIKGLQVGADVYIEKPFDIDYLKSQIESLLQSVENMRQAFSGRIYPQAVEIEHTSVDMEFMQRAHDIITRNLDNANFNIEMFVREMAYSRTICYSKIKALTGMTINEFMVTVRLKTAATLLVGSGLSVSEIAYKVGFNDPNYFNTCFKKYYNMPPKSYARHIQSKDTNTI